jgi:hypothetical protein
MTISLGLSVDNANYRLLTKTGDMPILNKAFIKKLLTRPGAMPPPHTLRYPLCKLD